MGETELTVPTDHPAFDGHFPGRPILPGVVLLAEALAAVASASGTGAGAWDVASAKFLAPVGPGTPLALRHEIDASGRARFAIRAGDLVVATGVLARHGAPR